MKIFLNEDQLNALKLPPFIYKAIKDKKTSLGDNPALPPYGDFGFEYDVVKHTFEDVNSVIDKMIERGELKSKDTDYLLTCLSKLVTKCKKIEKPIRPQLEKLCYNIVNRYFSIPEETIILKCNLVSKVKPKNSVRVLPEENSDNNLYTFEDLDEIELANKTILKRRFINSLIQGVAYWLSTDLDDWFDDVFKMNNELWDLWYKIKNISNYLLFTVEEKIDNKNPFLMSYVEVKLGTGGKKTVVSAQGTIFPYLLRDTIRGLFELFSSHGLPKDNKKAMYILKRADFLAAEPWDLRLGMGIIDILQDSLTNKYKTGLLFHANRMPFFFTELCKLPTDEFNDVMKNFIVGTNKGERIAKELDKSIVHDIDYQRFKDKISQKNIEASLISDDCFSKEELDDYDVIEENETNEMMAYHGTGADFDKFNHKKYLNTGAHSQTFGWGTYVTDDKKVALGYSENSKSVGDDTESNITNFLIVKYGYNCEDANREAHDILANFRWAGSLKEFIELCEKGMSADWNNEEQKERDKRWLDVLTSLKKENAYIYEVDIPDDNGQNYFEWYEHFPKEYMVRVIEGLLRLPNKYIDLMAKKNYPFRLDLYDKLQWIKQNPDIGNKMIELLTNDESYHTFFSAGFYSTNQETEGKNVYNRLRTIMGSDKAASLFLMQCGFDGIKYPSGTRWQKPDGASEDAMNYVIFDSNKVKIINKAKV